MYHLDNLGDGLDLVELCGGEGRVSTIAIRRHLKVGENFDLVTYWDLNDPKDQARVVRYFKKYRPLVAIMGPTCKPFGKLARYNYVHHYDTWKASYEQAAPHGRFCGELALLQDKKSRDILCVRTLRILGYLKNILGLKYSRDQVRSKLSWINVLWNSGPKKDT